MARKAPVYLLIDTSGSMGFSNQERIVAANNGVQTVVNALRQDAESVEKAWLSVITFDSDVKVVVPLQPIQQVQVPELKADGGTNMAGAITKLNECLKDDLAKNDPSTETKGDYKAFVMILSDGYPNNPDKLKQAVEQLNRKKISYFVAAAVDGADKKALADVVGNSENVFDLSTSDMNSFERFFRWVSQSASASIQNPKVDDGSISPNDIGELPAFPDDEEELL